MKITIDVPDARFKIGDTIRLPNKTNGGAFIYRIIGRHHNGEWWWDCDKPRLLVREAYYFCKPQAGSVFDNAAAKPFPKERLDGPDNEDVHCHAIGKIDERAELLTPAPTT